MTIEQRKTPFVSYLTKDCRDKKNHPVLNIINVFPEKEKSKFIHCKNLPRTMNTTMMDNMVASQAMLNKKSN